MKVIKEFQDEYRFLSNFYPAEVEYEGLLYPTSEHAFQAAKSFDFEYRERVSKMKTPGQSKRAGRKVKLRPDWENKKIGIMEEVVRDKFTRNPQLTEMLLATGNAELQEGNNWGDRIWGMVNGQGANNLGKILMRVRKELRDKRSALKVIEGDLFTTDAKFLVHQCNCVTQRAAHLSKAVFSRYPYADIYKGRTEPSEPGTIVVRGNGQDERYVINLLGQFYPGTPKYANSNKDGFKARQKYFYNGLLEIAKLPNLETLAFPWCIGCGAAGGDWDKYLEILTNFAKYVRDEQGAKVLVYRLP